jgi:hypothetical protein
MPKLNDTQSVLLATAAQRDSGSLYPLPETVTPGARVSNAVVKLLSASLVQERETSNPTATHRIDGDLNFGIFVTPAGLQAIGIEPTTDEQPSGDAAPPPAPLTTAARETKASQVLALLSRPDGATLAELIDATGWLPHTTRAALTGLRKKGHTVERGKRGDDTCYFVRVAGAA